MNRLLEILPILLVSAFMTAGFASEFAPAVMRTASLIIVAILAVDMAILRRRNDASPIAWTMAAYLVLGAAGFWLWPTGLGQAVTSFALPILYLFLLITAALPQMAGKPDTARVGDSLPVHHNQVGGNGQFLAGSQGQGTLPER